MEKVIGIFDNYFLVLVLIEGCISIFIDAPSFKESNMIKSYKQSRYISIFIIIISLILYILQGILF
ncbi:CLC_0170 family protein [Clostridium sp. FAM 1755]|uniref:Uncharacterized protein n=1 Tax=Clostridium botulinum TaxID=1491 RepID=A0A6M0SYS0_CLOBO|nr:MULTISPECIES: CLC_0170 family protein [Clostridium]EJP6473492.1 hypothetical protein [Clostridium botulinum]KOR26283.1 hypothetical protein ND00_07810 [Clostridium sp. L74]NFA60649.1 hypothetical protein [Clostridium botulinum]NFI74181.1 hypothetical protein [Clostridium sporogenes]NFL72255.1 hypothetical protein [Clostridium sporogenes]